MQPHDVRTFRIISGTFPVFEKIKKCAASAPGLMIPKSYSVSVKVILGLSGSSDLGESSPDWQNKGKLKITAIKMVKILMFIISINQKVDTC